MTRLVCAALCQNSQCRGLARHSGAQWWNGEQMNIASTEGLRGADRRGFSRIRNKSECSSSPPSVDKKRPLPESHIESMSNKQTIVISGQTGVARGLSHSPAYTPNDRKHNKQRKRNIFEAYLSREEVSAGLKRGELIQNRSYILQYYQKLMRCWLQRIRHSGSLRINPKKFHEAFLPSPSLKEHSVSKAH
ncbi:unnamed protein product [Ranitomeya imitator]|uniref:Uncharacterized protein n=1 Tax=Ranitomeya imitator TaxID=111125 RepID=A0ABN9MEL1_9NEOB|nr:unnamed protein product [Ranitomeya imitator]